MKDTLSLTYFEDGTLTSDIEKVNMARQLVQDANAKAVRSAKLIISAHGAKPLKADGHINLEVRDGHTFMIYDVDDPTKAKAAPVEISAPADVATAAPVNGESHA